MEKHTQMDNVFDKTMDWVHYLTRPFSLFGASLWNLWYDSKEMEQVFGKRLANSLYVEEYDNVVRNYRPKEELEYFTNAAKKMILTEPARCKKLLETGLELNSKAKKLIEKGADAFPDLQSSVDFLIKLAVHSTLLPFRTTYILDEFKIDNKELARLSEKLRVESYYPNVLNNIVIPLAKKQLKELGVKDIEQAINLITFKEILSGSVFVIESRKKLKKSGKKIIYCVIGGNETIRWVDDTRHVIARLEKTPEKMPNELKGQVAYPGKTKGIARVVLSFEYKSIDFNEGDILVSINSSPKLMPLIIKCGGIVTDEGGVTCHAAVIGRKLKKPCIIGTKYATKALKDGDLVEVDANKGIVRKIK